MIISYLLVFLLAAIPLFELVAVVPIAIIGGLSPIPVAILGFFGNLLTVVLLIVFVDRVKAWMKARKQKKMVVNEHEGSLQDSDEAVVIAEDSKKEKRARRLFDKYGLPGLTILGPFLVGSHITAFMSMSFSTKRSAVTTWMTISLVIWTIISATTATYGVNLLLPNVEEDGFLIRLFQ